MRSSQPPLRDLMWHTPIRNTAIKCSKNFLLSKRKQLHWINFWFHNRTFFIWFFLLSQWNDFLQNRYYSIPLTFLLDFLLLCYKLFPFISPTLQWDVILAEIFLTTSRNSLPQFRKTQFPHRNNTFATTSDNKTTTATENAEKSLKCSLEFAVSPLLTRTNHTFHHCPAVSALASCQNSRGENA